MVSGMDNVLSKIQNLIAVAAMVAILYAAIN
jgi:hypothetical protein